MDNHRALATSLLDALNPNLNAAGARIDIVADALDHLADDLRVGITTGTLGIAPTDRVTGGPLLVWDVIRDLRIRLDRVEDVAVRLSPGEERLANLERQVNEHRLEQLAATTVVGTVELFDQDGDLTAERLLRNIVNAFNDDDVGAGAFADTVVAARAWLQRSTEARVADFLEPGVRVAWETAFGTGVGTITGTFGADVLVTDDDPDVTIKTLPRTALTRIEETDE